MSRKGCSPYNAAREGVFGRLDTEMLLSRHRLYATIKELVEALGADIRWYYAD